VKDERIFAPVSVLALWTGAVLLLTAFRRLRAVAAGRIRGDAFRFGESPKVPPDVVLANRNFMNLLEMPLLFYVVCIALYVTHHVGRRPLTMAWIYVGLRLAHSLVHLTTNRIRRRLTLFALSNFVLLAMWIGFLRGML